MATHQSSPFTRAVVSSMRRLYPESLADHSFDNTGLLLEAPYNPRKNPPQRNSVLLTIDLTTAVADEAIAKRCSTIVTYHPIIFRALKNITLANSQQRSLLRLAAEGISVYSPHTAIDAAKDGNGDWIADIVTGELVNPSSSRPAPLPKQHATRHGPAYSLYHYPADVDVRGVLNYRKHPHHRTVIQPNSTWAGTGIGRHVLFEQPQELGAILSRIAAALGTPKAFTLATPQGSAVSDIWIESVAICAGSGGSVLMGPQVDADLLVTGEMSHHEALAMIEQGKCVVQVLHSNSERGYLRERLRGKLEAAVADEWEAMVQDGAFSGDDGGEVRIEISESDRDPFGFVVLDS